MIAFTCHFIAPQNDTPTSEHTPNWLGELVAKIGRYTVEKVRTPQMGSFGENR
jgi:hypothetical protein